MESVNENYEEMKDTKDKYQNEVKKAADIVTASIEQGELSELSIRLSDLPSVGREKEKYVFENPKSVIYKVAFIICLIMLVACFGAVPTYVQVLMYSDQYNVYAISAITGSVLSVCLNIYIIFRILYMKKFGIRYEQYLNILRFKNVELVDDIASCTKISANRVMKDISLAVKRKLIPQGHFTSDNLAFIVSDKGYAVYKEKQAVYDRYYKKEFDERQRMKERPEEIQRILDQGQQYIDKIHTSNDIIKDKIISKKLERMEKIVTTIFHEVDINPKQADKLGMFMSYYLPTTDKLLQAYIDIDEKNIKGKTLKKTKKDIEDALDKILDSFEGLLDKFYEEQDMDVSSEISAMETLMKQEGLVH